jgi:Sigma-70, region 4
MKAWLFTILRNTWLNQCRRSRAVLSVINLENEAEICADPRADPHNQYILSEERTRVQNAIQKLPTNLREIILLRVYEELSYQEIAGILCCPTGTVMSRLSRARSQLRELLSKWLQAAGTQLGQWSAAKLSVESKLTSTEQQYTRLYAALKALPPYAITHRRIAIEQQVYSMKWGRKPFHKLRFSWKEAINGSNEKNVPIWPIAFYDSHVYFWVFSSIRERTISRRCATDSCSANTAWN